MVFTVEIQRGTALSDTIIKFDHEYTTHGVHQKSMPKLTSRDMLAMQFRQNWQKVNPREVTMCSMNLDDSLTSLGWLHNMNIMKTVTAPSVTTPPPSPTSDVETHLKVNIMTMLNNSIASSVPKGGTSTTATVLERSDYRSNPYMKPPYSYATLICMAMKETGRNKITLSCIYHWITDNFMYYRLADPSWQNSIRHNLSLNKCFQKVPRRKDEPGKGGFWRINPEYSDLLVDGVLKKRRQSVTPTTNTSTMSVKRIKLEPADDWSCSNSLDKTNDDNTEGKDSSFGNEGVSASDFRSGNFSWNQLLNEDIMVGGTQIKSEDIIDDKVRCLEEEQIDIFRNPPESRHNSESSEDDIWNIDLTADNQQGPLDLSTSGFTLDLTVQGVGVRAPDWWDGTVPPTQSQAGMNTPVHETDCLSHAWVEPRLSIEEAIDAFNIDNLFDHEVSI